MEATDEEMEGTQLLAGLTGFNKDKGLKVLHEWCYFCNIKECVFGEHWLKEPMVIMNNGRQFAVYGHRHDQSILSILRIRHKLPTVLKTWEFYEFRSLEHAEKTKVYFTIIMEVMSVFSYKY